MDGYNALQLTGLDSRPARWFDDITLGERFQPPPRSITPAMIDAFATAAGFDQSIVAIEPFHLLLHSICTSFTDEMPAAMVRLISQSCRFVRDARPGDMLRSAVQVVALEPDVYDGIVVLRSTIHNQRGEMLMEGEQHYLVRRQVSALVESVSECSVIAG